MPAGSDYVRLNAEDGDTRVRLINDNCIELLKWGDDIQLTREEIAELARRFPATAESGA